jgi:hypothetical protein
MPQHTPPLTTRPIGPTGARAAAPAKSLFLTVMAIAVIGAIAFAQDPAPRANRPAEASKAQEKPKPKSDDGETKQSLAADRHEDPLARELLTNDFPELPPNVLSKVEIDKVKEMGAGRGGVDRALIEKYIKHYAAELTSRRNLDAMMNTGASKPDQLQRAKALEQAQQALVEPLTAAASAGNAPFRREYIRALLAALTPLLKQHLHTRTFAAIALSRAVDEQIAKTLVDQINDKDQALAVKIIAAAGLISIAQEGRAVLPPNIVAPASQSVASFLRETESPFWPASCRMLEALGAFRVASNDPNSGKAELAEVAAQYLFDREAPLEVRSWAAWALGMVQVPGAAKDYNFELIAFGIGRLAVDIGEQATRIPLPYGGETDAAKRINRETYDRNSLRVFRASDNLLRLMIALAGDPQIRDSGLIRSSHPNLGASREYVDQVLRRVRAVAEALVALAQSAGSQIKDNTAKLSAVVGDLAGFLSQNPPKGRTLYRDGVELAAGASGDAGRGAAAPKGAQPRRPAEPAQKAEARKE